MNGITDRNGWAVVAGFAAIWVTAALVAAGITFHLGPVIVAGAVPVVARDRRAAAALLGVALALAIGIVLLLAGRMDGPSLLPWGGAMLESMLAAVAGGLGGYGAAALMAETPTREASRA